MCALLIHNEIVESKKHPGVQPASLFGRRYGRLVVDSDRVLENGVSKHWFKCDCGRRVLVRTQNVKQGRQKSCGCLKKEFPRAKTHGLTGSPTYTSWVAMRRRCLDPKNKCWDDYGGRGIRVCERWADFQKFLEDMGERPDGTSIERRDYNGDYTPENCYWATNKEQIANRRRGMRVGDIRVVGDGETVELITSRMRLKFQSRDGVLEVVT